MWRWTDSVSAARKRRLCRVGSSDSQLDLTALEIFPSSRKELIGIEGQFLKIAFSRKVFVGL